MARIILTNHVKKRAKDRGVNLSDLDRTVRFPDEVTQSKNYSSKRHIKSFGSYQIVVPIKRQGNDWITVSVWKIGSKQGGFNTAPSHKQFFLEKMISKGLLKLEQLFSRRSNR